MRPDVVVLATGSEMRPPSAHPGIDREAAAVLIPRNPQAYLRFVLERIADHPINRRDD